MGEIIVKNKLRIDLITSSPARRARQTAILIKEAAGINGEIEYDDRIYEASPPRLLNVISEIDEKHQSVMLVGHNPGLEGLLKSLAGELHPMPTAALAVIDLKIDKWNEISAECGTLQTLLRPRTLK